MSKYRLCRQNRPIKGTDQFVYRIEKRTLFGWRKVSSKVFYDERIALLHLSAHRANEKSSWTPLVY